MKYKFLLPIILIIITFFIPKGNYVELNHLMIIDKMDILCELDNYKITITEVIPQKSNNSITYKEKKYEVSGNNLISIRKKIENKYHKIIYSHYISKFTSNCSDIKSIKKVFDISSKIK